MIFATAFRDSRQPDVDFGSNIGGVILGGLSENLSLVVGFNHLLLVAIAYYVLSALLASAGRRALREMAGQETKATALGGAVPGPVAWIGRLAWAALIVLGVARMPGYLVYALVELRSPLEAFHFRKAVMVHHAWRVAAGRPLYPGWERLPYVANFYGPLAFWVVGLAGRATGAGIDGLFAIGLRPFSLARALATTAVVAWAELRGRYGRRAGWLGGVLSLGAVPMLGFSVMVRPDLLAETLGFSGLLLTLAGSTGGASWRARRSWSLAILTKQTAGIFLLAAAAAAPGPGVRARAAAVFASGMGIAAAVAVAVSASAEPGLVSSLLGHSRLRADPATGCGCSRGCSRWPPTSWSSPRSAWHSGWGVSPASPRSPSRRSWSRRRVWPRRSIPARTRTTC